EPITSQDIIGSEGEKKRQFPFRPSEPITSQDIIGSEGEKKRQFPFRPSEPITSGDIIQAKSNESVWPPGAAKNFPDRRRF
ncbi:MAG: hypothetical protein M1275_03000, partial [Patescibacteria group bacterium]|nr:hypothetical protein [Patescibacteria group bacterium]